MSRLVKLLKGIIAVNLAFWGALLIIEVVVGRPRNGLGANPFDGCLHVFIEVGSNAQIEMKNIYAPKKFHGTQMTNTFNARYGNPE